MARDALGIEEAAERGAARFGELLIARAALGRDRALAAELAVEARPVAYALLEGLAGLTAFDVDAPELREAIALASLLGRRAAVLGATPTLAVEIAPVLIDAIRAGDGLVDRLRAVTMEGYVAARDDAADDTARQRAASAIPIVELAPGVAGFFPSGLQDPDELERVVDELGRAMLERAARSCVVHLGGLREPDRERAARVFSVRVTCAMLGVHCVFSGLSPAWQSAMHEAKIEPGEIVVEQDLPAAIKNALASAGYELRTKAALGDVLKRWIAPRRDR